MLSVLTFKVLSVAVGMPRGTRANVHVRFLKNSDSLDAHGKLKYVAISGR